MALGYVMRAMILKDITTPQYSFPGEPGVVYPFDPWDLPVLGTGAGLLAKGALIGLKKMSKWYLRQARKHPYRTGITTSLLGSAAIPKGGSPKRVPPSYPFYKKYSTGYSNYRSRNSVRRSTCRCRRYVYPRRF